jgi:DNA polymerase-3 subunit delta
MAEAPLDRFLDRLAKGKPIPALLLLGADAYLRDLCRTKLIEAYVPEHGREWGLSRFSAADDSLQRALGRAQMLPMLVPQQVVFIAEVDALEKLGDDARDEAVQQLKDYLDDPAPFSIVVFEAGELDGRMSIAKTLMDKCLVVKLELDASGADRVPVAAEMAQQMARELKVELDRDAGDELAELLNSELAGIHVELEKLATYVGDRRRITRADVEKLVVSAKKYSVWEFADMLAQGQSQRALEFLDSLLREGEQPPAIVGAMAWMFRKLIEAQDIRGAASGWQVARQLGMRPETAEMALLESRKIPREQLLNGLAALYETDSRLKSGVHDGGRAVMEFLVARLTKRAVAKPARA